MKPELPAEQNIRDLCFTRGGLLVREFDEIFSDLFSRKNASHKEIISCLANGSKDLSQICKELKRRVGGAYSKHLDDLVKAGFVQRDFTWNLVSRQESKLSLYRLSDNYLRFYLKYIAPNRSKIEKEAFSHVTLNSLPGWESIIGLQFENLVVHNRKMIWSLLYLSPEEIIVDGPFFQNATLKQPGCQIDYMIQTRFSLYLCEVKFSKNKIGPKIIKEMEEKRKSLKIPKFCLVRPILIHVNGVQDSVLDKEYFDKVLDFGLLLT